MREADLAKPVAEWLRANGYPKVYAEVWRGRVDLVGWNARPAAMIRKDRNGQA